MSTETKTKAASLAAFLITSAMLAWIAQDSPVFVAGLPDWLEVPAGGLIAALGAWLAGYNAKHKPANMSESAVAAVMRRGARPHVDA